MTFFKSKINELELKIHIDLKKKLPLGLTIGDINKSNFSGTVEVEFNYKWVEERMGNN